MGGTTGIPEVAASFSGGGFSNYVGSFVIQVWLIHHAKLANQSLLVHPTRIMLSMLTSKHLPLSSTRECTIRKCSSIVLVDSGRPLLILSIYSNGRVRLFPLYLFLGSLTFLNRCFRTGLSRCFGPVDKFPDLLDRPTRIDRRHLGIRTDVRRHCCSFKRRAARREQAPPWIPQSYAVHHWRRWLE